MMMTINITPLSGSVHGDETTIEIIPTMEDQEAQCEVGCDLQIPALVTHFTSSCLLNTPQLLQIVSPSSEQAFKT